MAEFEHPLETDERKITEPNGAGKQLRDSEGNVLLRKHKIYPEGDVCYGVRHGATRKRYVDTGNEVKMEPDEDEVTEARLYWGTRKYDDPELEQDLNAIKAAVGLYLEDSELSSDVDRFYDLPEGFDSYDGEHDEEIVGIGLTPESFRKFFNHLLTQEEYECSLDYVWGDVLEHNHERVFDHFFDDENKVRPGSEVPEIDSEKEVAVTDEGDTIRFTGSANAAVGIPEFDIDKMLEQENGEPTEWIDGGEDGNYELVVTVDVDRDKVMNTFDRLNSRVSIRN
ncbi:MAG: hypothetical protein ABEJ72_07145 [Candidatus Aenigmatarchaeota archaeon]